MTLTPLRCWWQTDWDQKGVKNLASTYQGEVRLAFRKKCFPRIEYTPSIRGSCYFSHPAKWHLLARMIPLVVNNYNICELGPRGTGKSHIYKEISPNSILVSGGQTTVANLFYNMGARKVGLVGLWDVVAFDEVAGISFKDHDGVQIMKDYTGHNITGK